MWIADDIEGLGNSIGLFRKGCGINAPCYTHDVFVTGIHNNVGCTIKYNESGVQQQAAYYPEISKLLSLAIDQLENVYVTGYQDFSLVYTPTLTVMYNKNLVQQWNASFNNNDVNISNSIKVDINGNSYITGYGNQSSSGIDYLTIKYAPSQGEMRFHYPTGSESNEYNSMPTSYCLSQNLPNPFNPSTIIKYSIPSNAFVKITVYDVLGKEISTLVNEYKMAGYYNVKFDGSNLASGLYFYRIEAGSFVQTQKMLLMK